MDDPDVQRLVIPLCWLCLLLSATLLARQQTTDDEPKRQLKLSPNQQQPPAVPKPAQTAPANSIAVFKSNQADGTVLFSDRRPVNRPYQQLHFDCFACDPNSAINWYKTPLFVRSYNRIIDRAASEQQLDAALIRAVIHAESAFQAAALSKRGAMGLMQLMPDTAAMLGVIDPLSPEQNIKGGSAYLASLLKQYNGDVTLSLAAYNAGPGNVRRHKGVPPFAETQAYIKRVLILHKRYQQAA
ncbi:MAG: lytic transglycosylase [Rheinheimera sp.]|uniref:lytic transglycosylase domain-containing protein n=1 Tax=Arsukibacterium sp. UBA3155 TaxID=1946058 RepID=UPI000C8FF8E3|nr:lytic transglycosylase domain-containing protein [Arsukibacterium sp. UBA3155]MAD76205.1 lytic transglycosylase [Rheinheimera sp.]|tara:strand:- start:49841 stop:50566 length:726 start_codon:yes stop_codon:yes gene_type:complete